MSNRIKTRAVQPIKRLKKSKNGTKSLASSEPSPEFAIYNAATRLLESGRREFTFKDERFFVQFQAFDLASQAAQGLVAQPNSASQAEPDPLYDPIGYERSKLEGHDVA